MINKLTEIQVRLKAPKDKKNTFAGYTYRSAESILEAVKPLIRRSSAGIMLPSVICERIWAPR